MIVEISPTESIRTTVPVTVTITNAKQAPKVFVKGLGTVDVVKGKDFYQANFWAGKAGRYEVVVKGKSESYRKVLNIGEQQFMTFKYEFGFFILLFILFSTGLILWMKKLRKN